MDHRDLPQLLADASRDVKSLIEQLQESGKIILPLGESFSQVLTLLEKKKGQLKSTEICGCVFVPLVGKYGWRNEH